MPPQSKSAAQASSTTSAPSELPGFDAWLFSMYQHFDWSNEEAEGAPDGIPVRICVDEALNIDVINPALLDAVSLEPCIEVDEMMYVDAAGNGIPSKYYAQLCINLATGPDSHPETARGPDPVDWYHTESHGTRVLTLNVGVPMMYDVLLCPDTFIDMGFGHLLHPQQHPPQPGHRQAQAPPPRSLRPAARRQTREEVNQGWEGQRCCKCGVRTDLSDINGSHNVFNCTDIRDLYPVRTFAEGESVRALMMALSLRTT